MTTRECPDCGALVPPGAGVCPECSAEAIHDNLEAAKAAMDKADKATSSASDPYKAMETQVKLLKQRQRQLKEKMSDEEVMSDYKQAAYISKDLQGVARALSYMAKEMLAYQANSAKLVDKMTPEMQVAQILRWFAKLGLPQMKLLIDQCMMTYNEQRQLRVLRRAKREEATTSKSAG